MILILGSVYDDVLYFDTQLKKRREETFKDHFKIIFGELYGQNVVLAYNIFTNYMSSVVTTYLISKYDVIDSSTYLVKSLISPTSDILLFSSLII